MAARVCGVDPTLNVNPLLVPHTAERSENIESFIVFYDLCVNEDSAMKIFSEM